MGTLREGQGQEARDRSRGQGTGTGMVTDGQGQAQRQAKRDRNRGTGIGICRDSNVTTLYIWSKTFSRGQNVPRFCAIAHCTAQSYKVTYISSQMLPKG